MRSIGQKKRLTQRGAAMIQIMMLVGLMGLVAGGAMLGVDRQLSETARSGDESMEASTLGTNRGVFNESSDSMTSLASKSNGNSNASSENKNNDNDSGEGVPCLKPDGTPAKAGEPCGRGFWESLVNVTVAGAKAIVVSSDDYNRAGGEGVKETVSDLWNTVTGTYECATSEECRDKVANVIEKGYDCATNKECIKKTASKVVDFAEKAVDQFEKDVIAASNVVDSGDQKAVDEMVGKAVGKAGSELLLAAVGGGIAKAGLKGVKGLVKVKSKGGKPDLDGPDPDKNPVLNDTGDAPSKAGKGVPPEVLAAVDPEILKAIKGLLKKDGDSMVLPKDLDGKKLDKSGLIELLNHAPNEYALVRVKKTNDLYLVRGNKSSVGFVKGVGKGEQRLIYHNHPSNVALPSGRNMEAVANRKGDIAAVKGLNPKQQSTIIGSRNGTYRHRVPSKEEFGSGKLPKVEDDIIGGTGSKNTPEMKEHIPTENARTAKIAEKYSPEPTKPFSLGKMDVNTGRLIPPARLNDVSGTKAGGLANGAKVGRVGKNSPPTKLKVTKVGAGHVNARHGRGRDVEFKAGKKGNKAGEDFSDKSTWSKNESWRGASNDTFKNPDRVTQQSNGNWVYEKDHGRKVVGHTEDGKPVHKVRVVTDKNGKLVTSFPEERFEYNTNGTKAPVPKTGKKSIKRGKIRPLAAR